MSLANLAAYCFERGIPLLIHADKIEALNHANVTYSKAEQDQVDDHASALDAKAGFLLSYLQTQERKAAGAAKTGG